MDSRQNAIYRFALVFLLIVAGFVAVLIYIMRIQWFERDKWMQMVDTQKPNATVITPQRGNILDCEGRLLASSIPGYYVYMDTRVPALHQGGDTLFYRNVDSIAIGLARILPEKPAAEYKKMMVKSFNKRNGKTASGQQRENGSYLKLCPHRVSYIQKREIEQLPLFRRGYYKSGLRFEGAPQRKKPFGSLASRTLGTILSNGKGNAGLEKTFEAELHGIDGLSLRERMGGKWEDVSVREAVNGYDLVTTLDANLLDITETALRGCLERTQADWGCCILMEVSTGKIRAICNLDRNIDGSYSEKANHAVTRVEPGSTFKTIAMMAALDDGKVNLTDTFEVSSKGWTYLNATHRDAHPKDTIYTLRSALAVSSNIAFAKMILKSYDKNAAKFVDKLQSMGIRDSVYSEIPGAQKPRIDVPKDAVTLSRMAYGYSVELTPMQILTFYNGIANDGRMIRPYLVERVMDDDEVIRSFGSETLKASMCRRSTLEEMRLALHDVVWDNSLGTASVNPWRQPKAQSKLVPIAGKTGTAQLFRNGRYQSREHRMTFVGYFPEDKPQYTCLCMVEHPKNYGIYDAGMDCGRVVRQIAEKTIVYAGHYVIKGDSLVYEKNK
ncbi:MAG: penicillin-binding protein 2 [Paludibacteraceae bacterium]|nr:penicillin-binding protein 2 [Paludibacteraceae bacterium]